MESPAEEMEMIAAEEIEIGEDISSPLSPLTFSLYESFLASHCSCCFSPLSSTPPPQSPAEIYCSVACSAVSDYPLRLSQPPPDVSPLLFSDIRAAFRLLNSLSTSKAAVASIPHRIGDLLTNHRRLASDPYVSAPIRRAASVMAAARISQGDGWDWNDTVLEEAAICAVITNAVEVQDNIGRALGIAVYDAAFSWINHSCSPNACYRFVLSSPNAASFLEGPSRPKIVPHVMDAEKGGVDVCNISGDKVVAIMGRTWDCGPKVIVRSIKMIKKGEEITIAYTDLLQPKALRQSDLWSKYQFVCCCGRCAASPPALIDSVLEGIHASQPFSDHETSKVAATRNIVDSIDEAIDKFMSNEINSETCCETIEHVLKHGVGINQSQAHESKLQLRLWLHPSHYAALKAYMTLASAYKVNSIVLSAVDSISDADKLKAFDMSRISAAYSLFLAGATHHLFTSEPSIIIPAAKLWADAGESLLALTPGLFSIHDIKFTKCSSAHAFKYLFSNNTSTQNRDFKDRLSKLLRCVTDISQDSWSFLARGCSYLQKFRSPVDFSFQATWVHVHDQSISYSDAKGLTSDQSVSILQLGVHCLLLGVLLADVCYGKNSHLVSRLCRVLKQDEDS